MGYILNVIFKYSMFIETNTQNYIQIFEFVWALEVMYVCFMISVKQLNPTDSTYT